MTKFKNYKLLKNISSPEDIKNYDFKKLILLSSELRDFIINSLSLNPGHFGSSLGVVELTVALHFVFDTPNDKLIWDVGHQAYSHKILTGRKDIFESNRKLGGISGFPNINESKYDAFGVGHASTSISAALGIARGSKLMKENRQVVAIIGDGAMTGGLAFEGMNNAGLLDSDLLVILNDNNHSIDPNVGALKEYLRDITTSNSYNKLKNKVWDFLGRFGKFGPRARVVIQKFENGIKSTLLRHSNFFEALNLRYFGPVDGHNIPHLVKTLEDLKKIKGPKLLHVLTKKGKGFAAAENNQTAWHATSGKFNVKTGEKIEEEKKELPPKYQEVFGETIVELAEKNKKIVGITPAMPTGCSLNIMMKKMPDRAFDVGIAESHAVTFSAGLASQGLIPFCNIYSTFMQRAFDQVIHDVATQNLPVIFCLDRGGLVGEDGVTHQGVFDFIYMRMIPNMIVSAPMDEIELRNLMYTAQLKNNGPFSIRYPRGRAVNINWKKDFEEITIGTARIIQKEGDIAILSIGHSGNFVVEARKELMKQDIKVAHFDMRFVKPLDTKILDFVADTYKEIITIEEGTVFGGFASAVIEYFNSKNYNKKIHTLAIKDEFIEHGKVEELQRLCNVDKQAIVEKVLYIEKNRIKS